MVKRSVGGQKKEDAERKLCGIHVSLFYKYVCSVCEMLQDVCIFLITVVISYIIITLIFSPHRRQPVASASLVR